MVGERRFELPVRPPHPLGGVTTKLLLIRRNVTLLARTKRANLALCFGIIRTESLVRKWLRNGFSG
jgi:hypothetical protein